MNQVGNLEDMKMENVKRIEGVLIPFLEEIERKYQKEKKVPSINALVELNTKYCEEKITAYKKAHPILDIIRQLSGFLLFLMGLTHVIFIVMVLGAGSNSEKWLVLNKIVTYDVMYVYIGIISAVVFAILSMWMEHKSHEMVDEEGKKVLRIELLMDNLEFESVEEKYRWILKNYQSEEYNKPIKINTRHFKENLEVVEEIINDAQEEIDE